MDSNSILVTILENTLISRFFCFFNTFFLFSRINDIIVMYARFVMKKIVMILLIVISLVFISKINVRAEVLNSTKRFDDPVISYTDDKDVSASCDGIFTEEGLELIREVLNWVRILAPILLILLIALDLGSAVMSGDNDALSKAVKKIAPRMIGTVLLFFVPTIIRAVLNVGGIREAITIPDDPLCKSMIAKETINEIDYI